MSSNYPGTVDTFNVIGTANYMDEAGYVLHNHLNNHGSAIVNIENTLGTTAGSAVLSEFNAGDKSVRHQGGTIQDGLRQINDANGNTLLSLGAASSQGAYARFSSGGTVNDAFEIDIIGGADDVNFILQPRGQGTISLQDGGDREILDIVPSGTSAVNQVQITNASTENAPEISATGDDTDINLNITPKGSGTVSITNPQFDNFSATAQPVCKLVNSGFQSCADAQHTILTFDTETLDVGDMHGTANPTRATIPSGQDGYYLISGRVSVNTALAGKRVIVTTLRNGSVTSEYYDATFTGGGDASFGAFSDVVYGTAGEYWELRLWQNNGGTIGAIGSLAMAKLF